MIINISFRIIEYKRMLMKCYLEYVFYLVISIPYIMSVYPYSTESLACQISLPRRHCAITIITIWVLHVDNQHSF